MNTKTLSTIDNLFLLAHRTLSSFFLQLPTNLLISKCILGKYIWYYISAAAGCGFTLQAYKSPPGQGFVPLAGWET